MNTSSTDSLFSTPLCHQIISKKLDNEDFSVIDFRQTPFGQVKGFLGDHSSLKITIKRNSDLEQHNFFVKSIPTVKSQRDFVLDVNVFFKEKFFFTQFQDLLRQYSITVLDNAIPTCYHTDGNIFVFEDLAQSSYTSISCRTSLDIESVKVALKSIVKLHASAIILEEKKSFRLIDSFSEELAETFYSDKEMVKKAEASYHHGFNALLDLTHDSEMKMSKDLLREKLLKGYRLQHAFVKPSTVFRNTILHGDLWTNNMMFKFEDGRPVNCVIVDFQSHRYGPPAQDVVAFLHLTTNREFRKTHFEEALQFYYHEFDSLLGRFGLGGIISEDEFFASCDFFKQFALTQACTHLQMVALSEEIAAELLADPAKAQFVLYENKYDFVVAASQKDEIYRGMNFETFAELREFYENEL
ncbi:uncharacterized protein LOC135137090 [Zophobas morio]|uniref:uncharacterized protein LOC135137090 n=1 Tax=Zophobas morio TaxID=2755281 RepID=UPI0030837680